jgi:hypothetical protein
MDPAALELVETAFGKGVREHTEGGLPLVVLPNVLLPDGCRPASAMAIYVPAHYQGYDSRLFFEAPITLASGVTPATTAVLLLGRTMYAASVQGVSPSLPTYQAILAHVRRYGLPA